MRVWRTSVLFGLGTLMVMSACSSGSDERVRSASDALTATQQAKVTPSDGVAGDRFGIATAVSGNTLIAGADLNDGAGTNVGAAYVYTRSGTTWSQQAKLTPSDGAAGDNFGFSVAIDANTAVVGTRFHDAVATDAGAAYVYTRSGSTWSLQQKLTPSDGALEDWYGFSVAVAGETLAVGSFSHDAAGTNTGAAYVYTRSGSTWSLQQKIAPSDGGANDGFGVSVGLSGNTLLVGSYFNAMNGAAYAYTRSGSTWSLQQKITAADGAASDSFGWSVSVDADTALIGSFNDDDGFTNAGSAYVFTRSGSAWSQQAKLLASNAAASRRFGTSVSVSGDVGLIGTDNAGATFSYFFQRTGTTWSEQTNFAGTSGQRYGFSVALDGVTGVVGSFADAAGSAYVYDIQLAGGGTACTSGSQCTSGFCVDGVCCDNACGGGSTTDCLACSIAAGATADGTCALVATPTCSVAPGLVTLVAPTGTITTSTPTYQWQPIAVATSYILYVQDSHSVKVNQTLTPAQAGCADAVSICNLTPSAALQNGSARFFVQASNSFGSGPWGAGMPFTVNAPATPANKPTPLTPNGSVATSTPTYTWTAVAGSTQYRLYVAGSSGVVVQDTATASEAGCPSGTGNCSFAPSQPLFNGPATWWVRAENAQGPGPWSVAMPFTVAGPAPPGVVTLTSPSGPAGTNNPTYTWQAQPTATQYQLFVRDSATVRVSVVLNAATVCSGGTCSHFPNSVLSNGAGRWWVQGQNSQGNGPWGTGLAFTVP
jgi:hypothetical protein